jgi:hypothetical protein
LAAEQQEIKQRTTEELKARKRKREEKAAAVQVQYFTIQNISQPLIQEPPERPLKSTELKSNAKNSSLNWLMICFGSSLLGTFAYILYHFISSLHLDLFHKMEEKALGINLEIAKCANYYITNQCDSIASSIPHMAPVCNEWAVCMQKDPAHVERYVSDLNTRLPIMAQIFSSLLNSFLDPLSWKSVAIVSIWFLFSGLLLNHFLK